MLRRIYFIVFAFFIGILTVSCNRSNSSSLPGTVATPSRSAVSPSGRYELRVFRDLSKVQQYGDRFPFYGFQIVDSSNDPCNIIFQSKESYIATHTLYFLWDDQDRVWVYSGDVGTLFWIVESNGDWIIHNYVTENVTAPDYLKSIRPRYHQK
jgi:hypothetical protein